MMQPWSRARVVVLGTGGTIAGVAAAAGDAVRYRSGELSVTALVVNAAPDRVVVEAEQVAQLDSKDMDATTWCALAERVAQHLARDDVAGVVVTHGTDTLEETAWFLARTVAATTKPVVLTGAMRPANARSPDGPQNLADALAVAADPGARGVLAVFAGTLFAARGLRKVHPYRPDAFAAVDGGRIGRIEEGRVLRHAAWPDETPALAAGRIRAPDPQRWPRVEVVTGTAASDGRIVDLLVEDGVDGVVIAGTGNGSMHIAIEAALHRARERGVRVLRTTRCAGGAVVPGSGYDVFDTAGDLSPAQARVELLVRLLAEGEGDVRRR